MQKISFCDMEIELNEILSKLKDLLPVLRQNFDVKSIEIFGSYIRREQTQNSDLDILVSFNNVPSLIGFVKLKNYLSDQLNLKVDLVMKDALKPQLSYNILREAISI